MLYPKLSTRFPHLHPFVWVGFAIDIAFFHFSTYTTNTTNGIYIL